ncbi:hypothetical protein ACFLT4_07885 [Chloroflexota bacterium]
MRFRGGKLAIESLNVLVTSAIGDECQQQITNVSPRIKLTNVRTYFVLNDAETLPPKKSLMLC